MSSKYPAAILSLLASASLLIAAGGGNTPEILKILVSYGAHAKSALPELKQAAEMFDKGEKGFPAHMSVGKAADVRKAIAEIEAATDKPELRRIR